MNRPPPTAGMRHLALYVQDMQACEHFYTGLLGMRVEWRPDPDNVYLTSGNDNLALHRATQPVDGPQRLDHLGFILDKPADVDAWYTFLLEHQISMKTKPKTHRDGARSFYCLDPDGNTVQMIFHPPISQGEG
ncbi:MAG: VOC family protein [Gammaproteobacteria bacterium]|nr:VOC family protein [Gammaproteobacteria bacterium]MDH5652525.1 VOC family protein [Gammaproteobacteria bacterium]